MFRKEDFQNGMVVEMSDGRRRMFWNGRLIDEYGYIPMSFIDDKLYNSDSTVKEHIVKVFLTHDVCYFRDFLRDESLTCIWSRYN